MRSCETENILGGARRVHAFRMASALTLFLFGGLTAVPAADWHHVHLTVPDTKAAAEWYVKHFGGELTEKGGFDTALYGSTQVRFRQARGETPGSRGSSLDHIGFSFEDLDAKMTGFKEAGIKVLAESISLGAIKFGFVEDPWGTVIEVMQDPQLYGFHHIHLHSTEPEKTLEWYAARFGGEPTRYGGFLPAIRYGDMWLIAQRQPEEKAGTNGRVVDHIGWSFTDFDAAIDEMKAAQVKFVLEPRQSGDHRIAFIEAPGGVKVEVYENVHAAK